MLELFSLSASATSFTLSGLDNPATLYDVDVAFVTSHGESALETQDLVTHCLALPLAVAAPTDEGSSSTELKWGFIALDEDAMGITSYNVEFIVGTTTVSTVPVATPNGGPYTGTWNVGVGAGDATVNTEYSVVVVATNANGASRSAATVIATRDLPAVPLNFVRDTAATPAVANGKVYLKWDALASTSGTVTYNIRATGCVDVNNIALADIDVTGIAAPSYVLTLPVGGKCDVVGVSGTNLKGSGPETTLSDVYSGAAPSMTLVCAEAVDVVTDTSKVSIDWSKVTLNNGGSARKELKVSTKIAGTDDVSGVMSGVGLESLIYSPGPLTLPLEVKIDLTSEVGTVSKTCTWLTVAASAFTVASTVVGSDVSGTVTLNSAATAATPVHLFTKSGGTRTLVSAKVIPVSGLTTVFSGLTANVVYYVT